MLTNEEIKMIEDAISNVKMSILTRTKVASNDRSDAMYALQDLCDALGSNNNYE